jgi:hypothetical protein
MAKMITAMELSEIITSLLTRNVGEVDEVDSFRGLMTCLAETVANHCGGEVRQSASGEDGEWMIGIHANDSLPSDGGIWKNYDTDVQFLNGEEVDEVPSSAPKI